MTAEAPVEARTIKAALAWRATPVKARLRCVRRLRAQLAEDASEVARVLSDVRPPEEFLAAQLIPFLDACRFLERRAARILAPRKLARAPLWLWGVRHEILREPYGLVLIIGPSNYPFFLPAVQAIQALVAGNSVQIKPGAGGSRAARFFRHSAIEAGLPAGILEVLNESTAAAQAAINAKPDKIILTGSAETGRAVLEQAAPRLTPCTMELSGCDSVFVLPDADLQLAARTIAYGLRLNGSRTCIAPRRLIVWREVAASFERELRSRTAFELVDDPQAHSFGGTSLSLSLVNGVNEALAEHVRSPYRLGASIFTTNAASAAELAARIDAGSICVNDLIVPTADGRLPFAGRGESGFGVTRGGEGILELTRIKVISTRRGRFRPHLRPPAADDFQTLARLTRFTYGAGLKRWRALFNGSNHE